MPGQKLVEAAEILSKAGFSKEETKKSLTALFSNGTELKFTDISSEEFREYSFPGGDKVLIEKPLQLNVSKNGHRIFDSNGVSHYIPQGWIHLKWMVKPGEYNFVK